MRTHLALLVFALTACAPAKSDPQAPAVTATVASVAPPPSSAPAASASSETWGTSPLPAPSASASASPDAREPGSIERTIAQARPKLRDCYNEALKKDPSAQATLRLTIVVATDGLVKSVIDAGTTQANPEISACVKGVIRALEFEPGREATTLNLPLHFAPPTP